MKEAFRVPINDGGTALWETREGERVNVEGVDAFAFEDFEGDWKIYEATSGWSITGYYPTMAEAVDRAKVLILKYGIEQTRARIAKAIAQTGSAISGKEASA